MECGRRAEVYGYDAPVLPPIDGENWLGLTDSPLPIGEIYEWCVRADCGAIVLFSGTVRDHAEGRTDVQRLEYEAYSEMVTPKLREIADETRVRWPEVGRIVLIHRVGSLELGESSVVAAVSSPHRPEAFSAARFAIDALKVSVPVWKREVWADGSDWGTNAAELIDASHVPTQAPTSPSPGRGRTSIGND
jgi:molybdopterin synthase catalytic subunit